MPATGLSRNGETQVRLAVGESGKHGAVRVKRATLLRQDGTTVNKTPGDTIMREQAAATNPPVTGTVGSNPSFSSGGGTGGKDVYSVALGTGEGTDFSAGDYVRAQSGSGGVYEIDTITGDTLKVFAGTGELDISNGNTIETVVPEAVYGTGIEVSQNELQGQNCTLEIVVMGQSSATRNNKPALAVSVEDRKLDAYWPEVSASSVRIY